MGIFQKADEEIDTKSIDIYLTKKAPFGALKRGEYRGRTDDLLHAMQAL